MNTSRSVVAFFFFFSSFPHWSLLQSGPTGCNYKANPMSTAITVTGEYLQWSIPAGKTAAVSARVQSLVPKSQDETGQAGEQEQYLIFHMMTVQLKPSLDNRGFFVSRLKWLFPHMAAASTRLIALFVLGRKFSWVTPCLLITRVIVWATGCFVLERKRNLRFCSSDLKFSFS